MEAAPANTVCFGPFKLDLKAGELHHNGRTTRLQEQPFQVLKMLIERPGQVVTREEIRKKLWPNDTIVEFDHSINAAIKKLRLALGDSAEEPRYVETVARRGYRLKVAVERIEAATGERSPQEFASQAKSQDAAVGPSPLLSAEAAGPTQEPALSEAKGSVLQTEAATAGNLTGKRVMHYRVLEIARWWGHGSGV